MGISRGLGSSVARTIDAAFFDVDWHSADLGQLVARFGSDLERGMPLTATRDLYGDAPPNLVPSPQPCPAWLCCLLPWLKHTPAMESYRACVADGANVVRDGKRLCIDAASVVPGEIISLQAGDIVPADARLLECDADFELSVFASDSLFYRCACDSESPRTAFLDATNLAFAGCRVRTGQAKAMAVATGTGTVLAALIQRRVWPLPALQGSEAGEDGEQLLPV